MLKVKNFASDEQAVIRYLPMVKLCYFVKQLSTFDDVYDATVAELGTAGEVNIPSQMETKKPERMLL